MDAKKLLEDLMDFDKDNIPDKAGLEQGKVGQDGSMMYF